MSKTLTRFNRDEQEAIRDNNSTYNQDYNLSCSYRFFRSNPINDFIYFSRCQR